MITPFIYGQACAPFAYADEKGFSSYEEHAPTAKDVEEILRDGAMKRGGFLGIAFYPFTKEQIMTNCIKYSISRCWRLGRAILKARKEGTSPLKVMEDQEGGRLLFKGKVIDLKRVTDGGFNYGNMEIEGFDEYKGKTLIVKFQNENLVALMKEPGKEPEYIASVPDLICTVDNDRYEPILTEDLRFGLRLAILLVPSVPEMMTEATL